MTAVVETRVHPHDGSRVAAQLIGGCSHGRFELRTTSDRSVSLYWLGLDPSRALSFDLRVRAGNLKKVGIVDRWWLCRLPPGFYHVTARGLGQEICRLLPARPLPAPAPEAAASNGPVYFAGDAPNSEPVLPELIEDQPHAPMELIRLRRPTE
jgi:hypothetical protein